jgi:hypothetical protein
MLALPYGAPAQDREPLLGTWRLNFAQSKFASGPPAYTRVTTKIEPLDDGMKVIYDMVGERGGVTHWEWMGRLDGKDYPLEGIEEVVTNAYSRVADRTYDLVFKVDGRITTTTRISISADGRTMTVTSPTNTAVYNKR